MSKQDDDDDPSNINQAEISIRNKRLKSTMNKKTRLQSHVEMGLSSPEHLGQLLQFLGEYMRFTEDMIGYTILVGDVVEQAIRFSNLEKFNQNEQRDEEILERRRKEKELKERSKNLLTVTQKSKRKNQPDSGRSMRPVKMMGLTLQKQAEKKEDDLEPDKSLNEMYKFLCLDHLRYFKRQYFQSVNTLIMRMYKSTYALFQLYPEFNDF